MTRATVLLAALPALFAQTALPDRERMLLERIEKLEQRIAALERRAAPPEPAATTAAAPLAPEPRSAAAAGPAEPAIAQPGATLTVNFDGYYGYNFNRPAGGFNALRAYDVSANSFAINQAGLIFERLPDPAAGRRFGARLDLQFGQATQTLQGSASNERRPDTFRNIFQAYGTYVAPVGKGLTIDFGKFASSFGMEGNYTRDQMNYSRSFWFSFLPFYHMGIRATYPVTGKLSASYWLVNGVNQTEDFNAFKSHAVVLTYTPSAKFTANLNYYNGQEQRTTAGRSHFLDAYFTWNATNRWTFAAEATYTVTRVRGNAAPQPVYGGAGYGRYKIHPRFSLAGRYTYLGDPGAAFTAMPQTFQDTTATATFEVADGFQMRWEYRRDWSSARFFPTARPRDLRREQNTALLGLIWWFGGKQGMW